MAKELTVTLYVGNERVEKLSDEYLDRMAERLSESMSRYYTDHPEEYLILLKNDELKKGKGKAAEPQGCKNEAYQKTI